jgi:hypothetical protein
MKKLMFVLMFAIMLFSFTSLVSADLTDDLASYYNLDEVSGTILDSTDNSNDGTPTALTSITGKINTAYSFNGASSNVTIPHDNSLNFTGDWSSCGWYKDTTTGTLFSKKGASGAYPAYEAVFGGGVLYIYSGVGASTYFYSSNTISTTDWTHICTVFYTNGTKEIYVNSNTISVADNGATSPIIDTEPLFLGDSTVSAAFNGKMDEVGLWNRALSGQEIESIYNGGNGLSYPFIISTPSITLNSPIDNYNSSSQTITFNITVTDKQKVENVSLYLDGVLNETNSSNVNGTYIFIKSLEDGDHNWSILAYNNNSVSIQSETRNFKISKYIENSIDYQSTILGGVSTTITQNISLREPLTITSASFYYNGTASSISPSLSGDYYILENTFNTPQVYTIETIPFYFEITLNDSTTYTLTSYNQTVSPISIDNCSVNSVYLYNFSLSSEAEQLFLVPATQNTTAELSVVINTLSGIQTASFSQKYSSVNPFQVCISSNLTGGERYYLDVEVKYQADDYEVEYYNIQKDELNSSSLYNNITLYSIKSEDSTEFQVSFRNNDGLFIEDAIVLIQRQYVSEGIFKTVEAPKTDSNGQTVAHLDEKDIVYNIIVQKNGVILGTFNNVIAFCEDATIGLCKIRLISSDSDTVFYNYDQEFEINYDAEYNETTRELTFDFTTKDNTAKNVTIEIYKFDQLGGEYLYTNGIVSSSGSFTYTIPAAVGNSTYYVNIYVDGDLMETFFVDGTEKKPYGDFGFFIFFIFLISMFLMFSGSKTMLVVGGIVAFIFAGILSLTSSGSAGVISGVIWLLVAGIILIYKLNQRSPVSGGN